MTRAGGAGEVVYKVKVQTTGLAGLDALTMAAHQAHGALSALAKVGGQQALAALATQQKAAAKAATAQAEATRAATAAARDSVNQSRAQAIATQSSAKAAVDTAKAQALQEKSTRAAEKALKDNAKAAGDAGKALKEVDKGADWGKIKSGAENAYGKLQMIVQGAFDAAKALADMAKEGAKLQTLDAAFKALGGSAKQMAELRDLTGGLVSDEDLQQASNLAKLFKLPAEEIPKLIKLAQGASAALGTTVSKAISDTFTAASRQSKMIADNMGIVIGDMSIMYSDYAKKHGKTVDQLTDKDKQLAFVQKMIAEGGRQMELATIGQGNAALKAEAQMANFERSLKMAAAEAFASSGAYDMMGGVLSQLQVAFTENGDTLAGLVMPAFKAVGALVVPLAQTFGALLPLLEPIAKLFSLLGATLTALAPIIGLLSTLIAKLSSFIIDIVFLALQPLLVVAGEVASLIDDDLAASFAKAADMIDKAGAAAEKTVAGLKTEGEAVAEAARQWSFYAAVRAEAIKDAAKEAGSTYTDTSDTSKLAASLGVSPEQLDAIRKDMARFNKEHLAWVAYQASAFSQAEIAKMSEDEMEKVIAGSKKSRAELDKIAQDSFKKNAERIKERVGLEHIATQDIQKLVTASQKDEIAAKEAAEAEKRKVAGAALSDMDRMINESASLQISLLAGTVMEGGASVEEGLKKIDEYYDAHLEHIRTVYGETSDLAIEKEASLARLVEGAAAALTKDKGGKGGGKGSKAPDWYKAEWEARLTMMDDYSRQSAEIETRYADQMNALHADQVQLRIDLAMKMVAELDALEAKRVADEKARALELSNYFKSEQEVQLANDIAAAEARAVAMREIARQNGQDNIEMMRQIAAQEEEEKLGAYGAQFGGAASAVGDTFGAGFNGLGDAYTALFDNQAAAEAATKAHEEKMAGMYQNMAMSAVDSMMNIAVGGGDVREEVFKMMGSMFGYLSAAFLAWAVTESALLSGNPYAAAGLAVALGVVGATISAFGSRGKGSGAKGTSSKMSRQSLESRKEDEKPQTIIYNYGFATPDSIARSVSRGDLRGQDLRGREKV